MHKIFSLAVAGLLAGTSLQAQVPTVDARYQAYTKISGISGSASSIGSDTMNNLMTLWLEGFRKYYPNVKIQIEGKGSSTAPPALIEGTAQFGPMSRSMKSTEVDQFEAKYGYQPTALGTALDALAVFVNKDNPIKGLSLTQVDAIFSKTRKSGAAEDITTWGQLGLKDDWVGAHISLYGRNSASGTYGFFKDHALAKGDYKDEVKEQPGSSSVVQGITTDRFGIGYSGLGYVTSGVRAVPLAAKDGEAFKEGSLVNVLEGTYPLGRYLFLYINKAPGKDPDPLVREFAKFVFSKEGQEIVIKDGFMPVPFEVATKELTKLNAK